MINVSVVPATTRFAPDDEAWTSQVRALHTELRRQVPGFHEIENMEPGAKGAISAVILSLGSVGAVNAAVQCFRAWLDRDKSRRIELTITAGDSMIENIVLEGKSIDSTTLQKLGSALAARLGREE